MTIKATIVMGINEGYFHDNEQADAIEVIGTKWQVQADKVFKETNIYVSAVVSHAKVVYHEDWGCPEGGEVVAVITSSLNPEFVSDKEAWKNAVLSVAKAIRDDLEQSTVTVEFSEIDLIYLQ